MRPISGRRTLRFSLTSSIPNALLSLQREADAVRVQAADTGIGIEAGHLPKRFRRLDRTDKARSRDTGGAGLGVAIAKSFTEAHGGKIQVLSAPDVGITFAMLFPAAVE